ncbi:MAG: DNA repair protein RecO [Deltaproteobacteria bacterium]
MEEITSSCLILRTRPFGESDIIAVLLSSSVGKLSAIAKGARRSKRRFAGSALEPFGELSVRISRRPGRSLALLHECRVAQSYHAIASDLAAYAWGCYLLELTEQMTAEAEPCPALYDRLRQTLADLATVAAATSETSGAAPGETSQLGHRYITALLETAGWGVDFTTCAICGSAAADITQPIVDPRGGGMVCARHEAENQGIDAEAPDFRPNRRVIFPELLAYMHALGSGDETLAEAEVLKAADLLLERLVDHHLTRIPRSRDFLMKVVGSST